MPYKWKLDTSITTWSWVERTSLFHVKRVAFVAEKPQTIRTHHGKSDKTTLQPRTAMPKNENPGLCCSAQIFVLVCDLCCSVWHCAALSGLLFQRARRSPPNSPTTTQRRKQQVCALVAWFCGRGSTARTARSSREQNHISRTMRHGSRMDSAFGVEDRRKLHKLKTDFVPQHAASIFRHITTQNGLRI